MEVIQATAYPKMLRFNARRPSMADFPPDKTRHYIKAPLPRRPRRPQM